MVDFDVNWLAVLITGIVNMVVGGLWYSPVLFGKLWVKLMGWSEADAKKAQKEAAPGYFFGFVATLVMTFVLANFVQGSATVVDGAILAFWIWLGFFATTGLGSVLWERRSFKLFALNQAYWLVVLMVSSAILVSWQ